MVFIIGTNGIFSRLLQLKGRRQIITGACRLVRFQASKRAALKAGPDLKGKWQRLLIRPGYQQNYFVWPGGVVHKKPRIDHKRTITHILQLHLQHYRLADFGLRISYVDIELEIGGGCLPGNLAECEPDEKTKQCTVR